MDISLSVGPDIVWSSRARTGAADVGVAGRCDRGPPMWASPVRVMQREALREQGEPLRRGGGTVDAEIGD